MEVAVSNTMVFVSMMVSMVLSMSFKLTGNPGSMIGVDIPLTARTTRLS